jgi:hypothetical protein
MSPPRRIVDLRHGKSEPVVKRGVRPPPKRQSALKVRRQRIRAVLSAFAAASLCVTLYAVHALSYLPQLTYQEVSVRGAQVLNPNDVRAFALEKLSEKNTGYVSGRNIFVFDLKNLSEELNTKFRRIKDIDVKTDSFLSNSIHVTIKERQSFGRWCDAGERCFALDENGFVFAPLDGQATSTFATRFIFHGELATTTTSYATLLPIAGAFAPDHFSYIISLLRSLESAGFSPVAVVLDSDQDFHVMLEGSYYLRVAFGGEADKVVRDLNLVLASDALKNKTDQLEYVDLRFGNRVYYRFLQDAPIEEGRDMVVQ